MIQQYKFHGVGRQIDCKGVFFRYESGIDPDGSTDIRLYLDGAYVGNYSPGDALELPEFVRRWEIKPVSSGCAGIVKIGFAKITTAKLAGTVSVIDGAKFRTMEGHSYSASVAQLGINGTPCIQLFNRSANRNIVVTAANPFLTVPSGTVKQMEMRFCDVEMLPHTYDVSVIYRGVSKKSGYANSISGVCGSDASLFNMNTDPAGYFSNVLSYTPVQTVQVPTKLIEPLILVPGFGLYVTPSSAATGCTLMVNFEWFEEDA